MSEPVVRHQPKNKSSTYVLSRPGTAISSHILANLSRSDPRQDKQEVEKMRFTKSHSGAVPPKNKNFTGLVSINTIAPVVHIPIPRCPQPFRIKACNTLPVTLRGPDAIEPTETPRLTIPYRSAPQNNGRQYQPQIHQPEDRRGKEKWSAAVGGGR